MTPTPERERRRKEEGGWNYNGRVRYRQSPLLVEIVVAAVLMHVLVLRGTAGSAV